MTTRLVATVMARTPSEAATILASPPPGVDQIELRLDALSEPSVQTVAALLDLPRSAPLVVTCRAPSQGGQGDLPDEQRLLLLCEAARRGADLIDVEDTLIDQLPDDLPGERIASCHLTRFMPRLGALGRRLLSRGTRFAKLAVPADSPFHLAQLCALQEELLPSLAVVPTGRLAEAGRVMLAARGSPFTYAAAAPHWRGHPDQPLVERLHDELGVGLVNPATRFYAVVGQPVAHSLSPRFHNTVFRGVAQNARMLALDVDILPDLLEVVAELRLDGLAITHPFKRDAVALANSVLPGARSTGAANTLLRTPTGWQARNTDWKAACDLLPRLLKAWRYAKEPSSQWAPVVVEATWKGVAGPGSRGKGPGRGVPKVLLLGTGGAARAMAVSLLEEDVELSIWSRRFSNAREYASELGETVPAVAVQDPSQAPADLLINATPVGMAGVDPFELAAMGPIAFREGAVVLDLTYGQGASPIRESAAAAGVPVVSGEAFFGFQARRQAEVFTGGAAGADVLRQAAKRCGLIA